MSVNVKKASLAILFQMVLCLISRQFVGAQERAIDVSLKIEDIMALSGSENTPTGPDKVDFVFDNIQKYQQEQKKIIADQINVMSTAPYSVCIMFLGVPFFENFDSPDLLPMEMLRVSAGVHGSGSFAPSVVLGNPA